MLGYLARMPLQQGWRQRRLPKKLFPFPLSCPLSSRAKEIKILKKKRRRLNSGETKFFQQ